MVVSLGDLADHVGGEVVGDPSIQIMGVATLQNAQKDQIAFLANSRYRRYLDATKAGAVILGTDDVSHCRCSALVVENPYLAYAHIAVFLNPEVMPEKLIHPSAVISPDCLLADDISIGPNVVIESGVSLGAGSVIGAGSYLAAGVCVGQGTRLYPNVSVYSQVNIGDRVVVHSGAVLGSDGFGMASDKGVWVKVPQLGSVVIGDDVEIGANTTIDRGALDDTVIEDGVRLDNQIQIAHNVRIGAHTAIAGCVGVAGSTQIGKRCQIGGGVGIVGHLDIADDVCITAMSLVTGNINKPGLYSSGTALESNSIWQKNAVRFRQLDDMARRLKDLDRRVPKE